MPSLGAQPLSGRVAFQLRGGGTRDGCGRRERGGGGSEAKQGQNRRGIRKKKESESLSSSCNCSGTPPVKWMMPSVKGAKDCRKLENIYLYLYIYREREGPGVNLGPADIVLSRTKRFNVSFKKHF